MEKDIPELPDLASVVLHPAKGMLGEGIKLFNRSFYCMIIVRKIITGAAVCGGAGGRHSCFDT